MAFEIMSDSAPMLESDMPESSVGRKPQGITINQSSLSNLVQMNPQELEQEDTRPAISPPRFPLGVVQEFQACLSSLNCDRLLEMVNQYPAQLFLQTFDELLSRSALHVAVLKGSRALIDALLGKLKALSGGNDSKLGDHTFLHKVDEYGLSAVHMVALIADKEIISCFQQSFGDGMRSFEAFIPFFRSCTSEDEKRNLLEKASPLLEKPAPTSGDQETGQLSLREWLLKYDVDFVYCLHDATQPALNTLGRALEFVKLVCDNGDSSFLKPLLNVRNRLGRSPLHVYEGESSFYGSPPFKPLFEILVAHFPDLDWNMCDFNGRTPLHWAAAQGYVDVVTFLANQERTNLNATYGNLLGCDFNEAPHDAKAFPPRDCYMWKSKNFNIGQVAAVTPLHLAVIHNHVEVVEALLKVPQERGLDVNAICIRNVYTLEESPHIFIKQWNPFQLAAYMGHVRILHAFLKDSRLYDPGLKNGNESALQQHNTIPALHLAASQFHPLVVKALVDCRSMDILVKDQEKDTSLHYAAMYAHGDSQVDAHIHDYVTVSHFIYNRPTSRKPSDHDMITCIDILMQSGLDMEQRNKDGMTPTLHPSCPEKVQIWWLQKMAKEAQENKNNLITAANAISVTAALVATASFVGPLQPPLGLLDDGNQTWLNGYSQVKHASVEVFLFCDSLSFYLAIAAIVFAMLPSWPLPHEGLAQEVRIARRCVQVAVLLLFGSIIFVVCAFSAASIAIVPNQRWRYKTLLVISTSLGVLICFLILFLSFMRLLTLISSRSEVAKKISNVATRIMLWERDTSIAK